jgi:hypothetical protein
MKWTNEFRDEMRQRQLARCRYSLIALLVVDFSLVLMLGYIWLNNIILYYIILSNKLRVFLPQQFVKALEKGEADSVPDYERRRLTVFFSDVKGFTAWTDKLEPEIMLRADAFLLP